MWSDLPSSRACCASKAAVMGFRCSYCKSTRPEEKVNLPLAASIEVIVTCGLGVSVSWWAQAKNTASMFKSGFLGSPAARRRRIRDAREPPSTNSFKEMFRFSLDSMIYQASLFNTLTTQFSDFGGLKRF